MDFQKTLSVCLIAFFSATLVVLIARALDNQAAGRLEPQLARIAEQLEALNAAGGYSTTSIAKANQLQKSDRVVVSYFYSNTRCTTCRAIESQTHEVVQSQYASQLQEGMVAWKTLNYEDGKNSGLMKEFEIVMPVVVLARFEDDEMVDWRRLDQVWGLVNDKPAFAKFIKKEIDTMLGEIHQPPSSGESQMRSLDANVLNATEEPSAVDLPLPE